MKEIIKLIEVNKAIAVIRHKDYEEAKKMCLGCIEGGVKIIEITLTVPNAFKLIEEMSKDFPEIIFGAGTILKLDDAKKAIKSGSKFLISPIIKFDVLEWCDQEKYLYIPGVMTVNEIELVRSKGNQIQKLFPANILSQKFVSSVLAPIPDLKLIPSGGVDVNNAKEWLKAGVFAISIGSNLVGKMNEVIDKDLVRKRTINFLEGLK